MAKIRRVDFWPTDWLEGTVSLTHFERSVYITVIAAQYASGGPVHIDHVRKLCSGRGFRQGLAGLIDRGKVTRKGEMLSNYRADKELIKSISRADTARINGEKGGRPNGLQKPGGSPSRAGIKQQTTNSLDSDSDESAAQPRPDPVKALWDSAVELLTGASVKNPRPLIGSWRREFGDAAVMNALNRAESESASDPVRFVIGCLKHSKAANGKRQPSPVEKLYEGGYRAALAWEERQRARNPAAEPLLDGGRSTRDTASSD
jgi:hypothetical protein